MEWNGSIPAAWNGSMPMFGSDKNKKWNGSVFCSVLELHDGTEQPKHNFFLNQNQERQKYKQRKTEEKKITNVIACRRGALRGALSHRRRHPCWSSLRAPGGPLLPPLLAT
jgi:hypothetical protein